MKQFSELELGSLKRAEQAKTDLIGTIWNSGIMGLLGFDTVETLEEKEAWNNIVKHLEGDKGMGKMEASQVYDLINYYVNTSEEKGFRMGFHIATRMFTEGMNAL